MRIYILLMPYVVCYHYSQALCQFSGIYLTLAAFPSPNCYLWVQHFPISIVWLQLYLSVGLSALVICSILLLFTLLWLLWLCTSRLTRVLVLVCAILYSPWVSGMQLPFAPYLIRRLHVFDVCFPQTSHYSILHRGG